MNKKYYISSSKKNIVELRILSAKSGGPTVLFAISMKDENKKDNIDLFKKDLLNND